VALQLLKLPNVLFLDEPTSGVAAGPVKDRLYIHKEELNKNGTYYQLKLLNSVVRTLPVHLIYYNIPKANNANISIPPKFFCFKL